MDLKLVLNEQKKHTVLEVSMSKERELLARVLEPRTFMQGVALRREIEELLAPPEQTEPVYWENEKKALLNEIDHLTNRLAQPEQTPDYYLWFDEVHEEHPTNEGDDDVMPLYASPPKREPLSDGTTADMWHANKKATHADSYWAGVSDAEKAHGITGVEDE